MWVTSGSYMGHIRIVLWISGSSGSTGVTHFQPWSGPYNVTFPAGVTRVSFNISICDDDLLEDNENFSLTINADSLPDGIIIGSPSTVMMIIRNDDSKCANFITIRGYLARFH